MLTATVPVGIDRWTAETSSSAPGDPLFVLDLQANERACRLRLLTVDSSGAATERLAVGQMVADQGWQFSGEVTASGLTVTVPAPVGGELLAWIELDFTQNYGSV